MHRTAKGLVPDPAFPEELQHLIADICGPLGAEPRINHLNPPVDSANADAETAPRIARTVGARVRAARPRGVVITHGTDTLAFTAARIAFELAEVGAPVVLTGSQFPYGDPASDAQANLALAVRAALRAKATAPVSIAFGGALMPAVRATKFQTDALDAFRAERPLAPWARGIAAAGGATVSLSPARVISFRFTPGVTADDLRAAVGGRPDGLVLECYGSGNAPTARLGMAQALREVCAQLPVAVVTQCATGAVDFERYAVARELVDAGAIDGGDLTLEAALAKLGYVLDCGLRDEALRTLMEQNLVGERTEADMTGGAHRS